MNPKPTNPKDVLAVDRAPLHLVPDTAIAFAATAHAEGAFKYGPYNWREAGVGAMTYVAAARRHLAKWVNGQDVDPVTGVHELASVLACINIVVDAMVCNCLTDDRPPPAPMADVLADVERQIAHLRAVYPARLDVPGQGA